MFVWYSYCLSLFLCSSELYFSPQSILQKKKKKLREKGVAISLREAEERGGTRKTEKRFCFVPAGPIFGN
jgi:hypothetical protein